jgi:imidazolonepropionase-like amidohydrolase
MLPTFLLATGLVAASPPSTLIRGARVIDARGDQGLHDVWVEDGRIAAIDPAVVPEDAQVLEAEGRAVVPGLIDSHIHITMAPAQSWRDEAEDALWVRRAKHLRAFLAWGITTVIDPGIPPEEARAVRALATRSPAPEILFIGPLLGPLNGYPSAVVPTISGISETRRVAERMDEYADLHPLGVKVTFEQGAMSAIWPLHDEEMRTTIVDEAHKRDLPLYIHAMNPGMTRLALSLKPHALVHASQKGGRRLAAEVAASGVYVMSTLDIVGAASLMWHPERLDDPRIVLTVPEDEIEAARDPDLRRACGAAMGETLAPGLPGWLRNIGMKMMFNERTFNRRYKRARRFVSRLHEAGVPLVVGADSAGWPILPYLLHGRSTHVEMGLLADAGLTPLEVLRAATLTPAEMVGMDAQIGTVEVGKRADLILVEGDPLTDVAALGHPVWVMRAGEARTPQGWMNDP